MTVSEAAELIKAIAELIGALIWPVFIVVVAVTFRKQIRAGVKELPSLIGRMEKIKIGSIEAELQQLAESTSSEEIVTGDITSDQIRTAAKVKIQSKDIDRQSLTDQMDRLAIEYDTIRRAMPSSPKRTRLMTGVLVQMRGLAQSVSDSVDIYQSSPTAGNHLAAIAMMQMDPGKIDLDWLVERFKNEAPFVFYHAALAMQSAANEADTDELPRIFKAARKALEVLKQFDGTPDQQSITVLDGIVRLEEIVRKGEGNKPTLA